MTPSLGGAELDKVRIDSSIAQMSPRSEQLVPERVSKLPERAIRFAGVRTSLRGGPIRPNLPVRICYADMEGKRQILRLEIGIRKDSKLE
jgi:hypothetical protein